MAKKNQPVRNAAKKAAKKKATAKVAKGKAAKDAASKKTATDAVDKKPKAKKRVEEISALEANKKLAHEEFPEFLRVNFESSGKRINEL